MDFETIFFGGLSLLAYLKNKKKTTTTESTSTESTSNNVDNNIQFVSDSEYNKWLNDKLKSKYEAEKAEREAEEAEKAAEEAAAKAEEKRLRKLGKVAFDYNLNNYPKNLENNNFNNIPDDFYNFTDPESLLQIGIDQDGNWSNAGLQLIEMCRFRIFPDTIYCYTKRADRLASPRSSSSITSSYYTVVCELEIANPTDRSIKFLNKMEISKLEISGIDLKPYGQTHSRSNTTRSGGIVQEYNWDDDKYKTIMIDDLFNVDLIVKPKSNAFFTIIIKDLYSRNRITEDTTNFSFVLHCNLFQDLVIGQKIPLHLEFRSFMGDKPEIISSLSDSYLKKGKKIMAYVKTKEDLKSIYNYE